MSERMKSESREEPRGEERGRRDQAVAHQEMIIARAFRISLVVFIAIGAALALAVYLLLPRKEEERIDEIPLVLPRIQERPVCGPVETTSGPPSTSVPSPRRTMCS